MTTRFAIIFPAVAMGPCLRGDDRNLSATVEVFG